MTDDERNAEDLARTARLLAELGLGALSEACAEVAESLESGAVIHDPDGLGFRIERLWAFLAIHGDGDEGVVGATLPGLGLTPLVAADAARLASLLPVAKAVARSTGKPVTLVRFDTRTDVETLAPE